MARATTRATQTRAARATTKAATRLGGAVFSREVASEGARDGDDSGDDGCRSGRALVVDQGQGEGERIGEREARQGREVKNEKIEKRNDDDDERVFFVQYFVLPFSLYFFYFARLSDKNGLRVFVELECVLCVRKR